MKETVASIQLVSNVNGTVTISTTGTKAGRGARLVNWAILWGDGSSSNGVGSPPQLFSHTFFADGSYLSALIVKDSKGKEVSDSVMMIVKVTSSTPTPPPPSGSIQLLDGFEAASMRVVNPVETDQKYRFIANMAEGAVNPSDVSYTTLQKFAGAQSLKLVWSAPPVDGAGWRIGQVFEFTNVNAVGWFWLREGLYPFDANLGIPSAPWTTDTYVRLRFRVMLPNQWQNPTSSMNQNVELGTYILDSSDHGTFNFPPGESPFPSTALWPPNNVSYFGYGMHFYHMLRLPKADGRWVTFELDDHPQYLRSAFGDVDFTRLQYPSNESGLRYMDLMPRFYFDVRPGALAVDGAIFHFDQLEYLTLDNEDLDNYSGPAGVYTPADNRVYFSFNRTKASGSASYLFDYRYAFDNIRTIGWDNATPCPSGTGLPSVLNADAYSMCEYSTTAIVIPPTATSIFIAVRRQGLSTYRMLEIPI